MRAKIRSLEHQRNDALQSSETKSKSGVDSGLEVQSLPKDTMEFSIVTKKLEEELKKHDALIETSNPLSKGTANMPYWTNNNIVGRTLDVVPLPLTAEKSAGSFALVRTSSEKVKTTPEGKYLTAALNDFDPEQYDSYAARSGGANKLLMLVLTAVVKAEARILYIRSLLARSPELQSIEVSPIQGFKVNIKPEKKSKFSSVILKLRGVDQETWWQHVTNGKLREITEEAKSFSTGNKSLAALFHLKEIAGTLVTEEAEDLAHVAMLRSALESIVYKRRKILRQMMNEVPLLTLEGVSSPGREPADARLASLTSLDGILKQVKSGRLLYIDHRCAQKQISDARSAVKSIPEEDEQEQPHASGHAVSGLAVDTDVAQWSVLHFNTDSMTPFIIKCGANTNSELVIKADARVQEPNGGEIVRLLPRPSILENELGRDGTAPPRYLRL
ncbi:hypothetical protein NL676_007982 [Syzygium grande]|nr:hypothetical protein NL676_007982 [Syzygium grande]